MRDETRKYRKQTETSSWNGHDIETFAKDVGITWVSVCEWIELFLRVVVMDGKDSGSSQKVIDGMISKNICEKRGNLNFYMVEIQCKNKYQYATFSRMALSKILQTICENQKHHKHLFYNVPYLF